MKKIYLLLLLISFSIIFSQKALAVVHVITVQNFSFAPSSGLTVNVGDTIEWQWVNGTNHNTTSISVPPNAATWLSDISSTVTSFTYPVTEVGTYTYECSNHSSMQASFTAQLNGINTPEAVSNFNFNCLNPSQCSASFNLTKTTMVNLSLYDLTGKEVRALISEVKSAGTINELYNLEGLQAGIYIIELRAGTKREIRRMIIQ